MCSCDFSEGVLSPRSFYTRTCQGILGEVWLPDRAWLQTLPITTEYRHISHFFFGNPEAKIFFFLPLGCMKYSIWLPLQQAVSLTLFNSPLTFISSRKCFLGGDKLSGTMWNRAHYSNLALLRCRVLFLSQKWPKCPQCDLLASCFRACLFHFSFKSTNYYCFLMGQSSYCYSR